MCGVTFFSREDVEDVVLDAVRRLTSTRDPRQAALFEQAPRCEVVPNGYLFGFEHRFELGDSVGRYAKNDRDALHFSLAVFSQASDNYYAFERVRVTPPAEIR